ncbi:MAG: hypothetical protein AAF125_28310, partial [Chloroflexota bacterium]
IGLVPVFGWAVKSGMMGAKAKVLGDAIIEYFKERSPLPDYAPSASAAAAYTEAPAPSAPPRKPKMQPMDDDPADAAATRIGVEIDDD